MNQAANRPHLKAVDVLLGRLDGVQHYGKGWRARCPACGGSKRKVGVSEGDDGRALLKCFAGCDAVAVVAALGLTLADLFPKSLSDDTPDTRRRMRLAAREGHWGAALDVLDVEAPVILQAAHELQAGQMLSDNDVARLALAVSRVSDARRVLRPQRGSH